MNERAIEAAAEVFRDAWRKPPEDGDDLTSLSRDFAYAALAAAKAIFPGDIVEIEVPARSSTSKDGMRYRGRLVSRET